MNSEHTDDFIRSYLVKMPKVELHAHLNGSLSQATLKKLIEMKKEKSHTKQDFKIPTLSTEDLSHCFEMFDLIHKITDDSEAIYVATCDVIEDFYKDGVSYLELRTTPKDGPYMTQQIYVETILKAINDTCVNKAIDVRLLLSIDRKRSIVDAEKTVKIAERFFTSTDIVVGLDFSGDPTKGNISMFIPILEYAKKQGLKLAVHIAEVPNMFEEVQSLLNLQPDRIGHGTFLLPCKSGSIKNFEICKKLQIPLEICLTSNIISKTVPSYKDHHFNFFREMDYPCVLCTDDKGVFNTTLSNEYYLAYKHYSLGKEDLLNLSFKSINYIFSPDSMKKNLREQFSVKNHIL